MSVVYAYASKNQSTVKGMFSDTSTFKFSFLMAFFESILYLFYVLVVFKFLCYFFFTTMEYQSDALLIQ